MLCANLQFKSFFLITHTTFLGNKKFQKKMIIPRGTMHFPPPEDISLLMCNNGSTHVRKINNASLLSSCF